MKLSQGAILKLIIIIFISVFIIKNNETDIISYKLENKEKNIEIISIENNVIEENKKENINLEETKEDISVTNENVQYTETPILIEDVLIEPKMSFTEINSNTRNSLVNVLCTTKNRGPISPISGSGIIIGNNGVILTNAHIAQYFLLKDYRTENFVECIIRTGSPAKPTYNAKLLYISQKWIEENSENLKIDDPIGTGENDFAFLVITGVIDKEKDLETEFNFTEPDFTEENLVKDKNVLLAGYPAGFLGGILVQKSLYITSTITQIKQIFTFKEFTYDVISVGGSIVAQNGISGGAVVSDNNKLIALISTSSSGETTNDRDLHAITLSHINRSLMENESVTIQEMISGNVLEKSKIFNEEKFPILEKILFDVLD